MNSKKIYLSLLCALILALSTTSITSCKVKEGCGYEQKMAPKTDKNGKLSREKGKSKLFG